MKNNRVLISIIVVALGLAGIFCLLNSEAGHQRQKLQKQAIDLEYRPFQKDLNESKAKRFHRTHLQGQQGNKEPQAAPSGEHSFKAKKQKAKKKKKKKKDSTKKKKENKTPEDETVTYFEEPVFEDDETDPASVAAVGALVPPVATSTHDQEEVGSYEYWANQLLLNPSFKKTSAFLHQYQTGQVTAKIFYDIASAMLEDERPQMNEMGFLLTAHTPSYQSFQLLATIISTQNVGSSLRNGALDEAQSYMLRRNLTHLASTLQQETSIFAKTLAAQLIGESAQTHLRPGGTTGTPSDDEVVQQNEQENEAYLSFFRDIISTLEQLSTNRSYGAAAEAALAAREDILNLLES